MAQVVLTSNLGDRFTDGETRLEVAAENVRQLLRSLEADYPGLGTEIEQAQLLAIDGEIYRDPFLQRLQPDAEVFVLPKIAGG
jgi:molybdopterin converting factor small subunit